jgi:hypothetical protein
MLEDAVKKGKLPKEEIFDVAYTITQAGMIDYAHAERPMMYQRLGAVGQLAGSLATFKHGMLGQQGKLIKDALTTNPLKGGWAPAAYSAAVGAALMGVKGMPGYQELDAFVQMVTNWFGKEPKNIQELALENSKDWVQYGALSAETGINFSSRLSAANLVPDSIPEMISPYANMYGDLAGSIKDVATNPSNPQMWKNLAVSGTPNFAKGAVEQRLKMRESTEGPAVMNRQGQLGNPRTERDQQLKEWGLTSLPLAKQGERQYFQMERGKAAQDAQRGILTQVEQEINTGHWNKEVLDHYRDKYVAKGGNPQNFINHILDVQMKRNLPRQKRLEGIPTDSLSSINRYDNYNR